MIKAMLTTSTLGLVLPNVKEEYGEGKPFDAMMSLSSSYLRTLDEDIQDINIKIGDDGMITLTASASVQILVEKIPTQLEDARTILLTVRVKAAFEMIELEDGTQELEIKPHSIQFPNVKIFKNSLEQPLEQMLLQSLLNVQVANILTKVNPQYFPLSGFFKLPEIQCLGIKLEDPSFLFHKGFITFDVPFVDSDIDPEFCVEVEAKFKEGPLKAFEQSGGDIAQFGDWKEFVKKTLPHVLPKPNPENRPRREEEKKSKQKPGIRKSVGAADVVEPAAAAESKNEDL